MVIPLFIIFMILIIIDTYRGDVSKTKEQNQDDHQEQGKNAEVTDPGVRTFGYWDMRSDQVDHEDQDS